MDGQMKVVSMTLVQLSRDYTKRHPRTWDENLIYIHPSCNWVVHISTSKSYFEICLGYLLPSPLDIVYGQPKAGALASSGALKGNKFIDRIGQIHP
jgi:hypothetical protein